MEKKVKEVLIKQINRERRNKWKKIMKLAFSVLKDKDVPSGESTIKINKNKTNPARPLE